MPRIKKNGTAIPKKILRNRWDELVDKNCLINGIKAGRLLEFRPDGRAIFAGNNNQFIIDINDISSLAKHI
ncbi:hypothetical protein [Methanothrix sp.]|uniref:hypothetical protein n=1 Tax=Methanothrix sp. TaxID=90426 RepID=UPI003BB7A125